MSFVLGISSSSNQSILETFDIFISPETYFWKDIKLKSRMKFKDIGSWALVSASFTNSISCSYIEFKNNGTSLYSKKDYEKGSVKIIPGNISSTFFSIFVHTLRKITKINRK